MLAGRDTRASVERIRRHDILVVGSFIMGLDSDRPGVGRSIAEAADSYGVDNMNVLFLTPLPGTRIWKQMAAEVPDDVLDEFGVFATYDELPNAIEARFGGISDTVEFGFEADVDAELAQNVIARVHQIGTRFQGTADHFG